MSRRTRSPALPETDSRSERVTLTNGELEAVINPLGGYLEEFTFNRNGIAIPLIYPKDDGVVTKDGIKTRGGCFAALPIFGPSEHTGLGLAQHGFARDLPWVVSAQTPDHAALRLNISGSEQAEGVQHYRGLVATMHYQIHRRQERLALSMALIVENKGDSPMFIFPGFHPYIALPEGYDGREFGVITEDEPHRKRLYSAEELDRAPEVPMHAGVAKLSLGEVEVELSTREMPRGVLWSDDPKKYVCFEPTVVGKISPDARPPGRQLQVGDDRMHAAMLTWRLPD